MSLQVYDDFGKAGYSLTDYNQRWMTPNGLGEMAVEDTRSFSGGRFHVNAVPFQTGFDAGVDDHRKYLAVSTRSFTVPSDGTLVLSADVKASTPGTVPGLTQLGAYGPSGSWRDPAKPPPGPEYTARRLQGQQAGVVMNVLGFCTGQVFDWFVASDTAFALIERAAGGGHRERREPRLRRRRRGRSQHDVHADHRGGPGAGWPVASP